VLRTEESRELNTVVVPKSIADPTPEVKVAFLASKQKAVETRMYSKLLRTVKSDYDCYLKDNLCMECPRCALFGAVSTRKGKQDYNIRHRIEYSTAFSIEPYEDLLQTLTFNAVDEHNQLTGQALNLTHNVTPLANFPSVITLNSVTWSELALYLKTLMATKSYGAETRVKGDVRNSILGIVGGFEEIITSLEYSLELSADWESDLQKTTYDILKKYSDLSASKSDVVALNPDQVSKLIADTQALALDSSLIEPMFKQVNEFTKVAKKKK
jgi:CRISPR-associated protein Csc2